MSELQQIVEMLQRLDAKHEKLAAQVESLARPPPSPSHSSSYSHFRSPSFPSNPNPYTYTSRTATPSSPPSQPVAGTDIIPCGPAASASNPYGVSPGSMSPASPRSGGGVEALRLSRASFSALNGSAGSTGASRAGLSQGQGSGVASASGSGSGSGSESGTASGSATPYANLSLAGAVAGGGAPGSVTPSQGEDKQKPLYPSRVVLTTYPGQTGIDPIPIQWGAGPTGRERGPVVCSRIKSNLPIRNSIGAHAGSYSIYRALSIAMGQLKPDWRPDLTNTHPPFVLPPMPGWFGKGVDQKIVAFDPWGAMSQEIWQNEYNNGLDVRPTISQTKAHIKIEELDDLFRKGEFPCDGEIVIRSPELPAFPGVDQGIEINTYKAAIDPVWYLPGVAHRLEIEESTLRRALFEDTGGMYPELLTRPDIKVFLPPIGGMTLYILGDPAKLQDPTTEVTCRPHDSCSGSDVFGSDICTCRPYLIFGIQEAIKCAQRGGVGVIVYFQKEGRALGEVVKYMVYNRRKRGGDNASEYFNNTAMVAGVKDARHQALMPDVLHFLGIKHIHNLISMSNLKYDAIIKSGITVGKRYEIPDELIPADSRVEIDAKIQSGYFSNKAMNDDILKQTKGRGWEDIVH